MNILIIEDEAITADALESMLREVAPQCTVVGKVGSIRQAVQWLLTNTPDLIFMDIQLSDGLSFSIAEQVTVTAPVIFTTAYDQFALQAFRLNSVDYLLKPYDEAALRQALFKFQTVKQHYEVNHRQLKTDYEHPRPSLRQRFLVQVGTKLLSVDVEQVAYAYALEKCTYLCTFARKTYDLETTLDRLELELDPTRFFRINRKFIVNIRAIVKMLPYSKSRWKLDLQPPLFEQLEAIVSIDRSVAFKRWLNL